MKKIFVSSFLVLAMALTGCQDAIDITQKGQLTEEVAFQTVTDLKTGMNIVYAYLDNKTQIGFNSIWTDEVGIGYDNGGQGLSGAYTFSMNAGNEYASGIYATNYYVINRALRVLKAAETITPSADEQTDYNRVVAECKFIIAYAHFDLLTYFSTDLKNPTALGVPILDFVPTLSDKINRSTNQEVLDFIQDNLTSSAALLPTRSITENTYINANTIKALRSRIALYTGDYPTALTLSNELISAYALPNTTAYKNIWTDAAGVNGVIFKLERMTGQSLIADLWQSVDNTNAGSSFYEVGRALFNQLDENDVRRGVITNLTAVTGSQISNDYQNALDYRYEDILLINKYPGSGGLKRLNDIKIFRVEEQYFIKAEAQARLGQYNESSATLQTVVNIRYTASPPIMTAATLQEALANIVDQRRIELAFEGFRYVDLKRLGTEAGRGIDRDPRDLEIVSGLVIPTTDSYKFTLPIPAREVTINPGLVQNPGY